MARKLVSLGYLASHYKISVSITEGLLNSAGVEPAEYFNGVAYYDESQLEGFEKGLLAFYRTDAGVQA